MASLRAGGLSKEQESMPHRQDELDSTSEARPGLAEPRGLDEPFEFVPKKPGGDMWTALLEPLLKEDKRRCDAWKDEVQNLLIFAGLFSGVVTAFTVESYKNLQPDPNDTMIDLLAQIAARLDGPLGSNPSSVPLAMQQFSPSSSSIRINVFWFLSLVLSLTTVLVGIISLQWLREHQSYSNLSPREMYAVYNMRAQGLINWHVDKVFTALPVLLQCALILFLGGIIDFLHAFKIWSVIIPITVFTGFTFVFLVATTLLPSLQLLSLHFHQSSKDASHTSRSVSPPNQCPYKSPQSHAARRSLYLILRLWDRLYLRVASPMRILWNRLKGSFSSSTHTSPRDLYPEIPTYLPDGTIAFYVKLACSGIGWSDFDGPWLAIRDKYMQRALGRRISPYTRLGTGPHLVLPIYDLILGLQGQSYQSSTFALVYYCFAEVSQSMVDQQDDWLRRYLHDLLTDGEACLTDLFPIEISTLRALYHLENIFLFLEFHHSMEDGLFSAHRLEISLRLMQHISQYSSVSNASAARNVGLKFPRSLLVERGELGEGISIPGYTGVPNRFEGPVALQVALKIFHVFKLFELESSTHNPLLYSIPAQEHILPALLQSASFYAWCIFIPFPPKAGHQIPDELLEVKHAAEDAFRSTFKYIDERLNREIATWTATKGHPSLLFYLATLYTEYLSTPEVTSMDAHLESLHLTLCRYKKHTIDMGMTDPVLEERLCTFYREKLSDTERLWNNWYNKKPFSAEWWAKYDDSVDEPSGAQRAQ